jgi:hypothetical protein
MRVEKQSESLQSSVVCDRILAIAMRWNQLATAEALEILLANAQVSLVRLSADFQEGCHLVET